VHPPVGFRARDGPGRRAVDSGGGAGIVHAAAGGGGRERGGEGGGTLREAAAGGIRYLNMNSNSQLNAVRNFKFTIPPEFRNTDFKFIFRYQIPGSGEPEPGGRFPTCLAISASRLRIEVISRAVICLWRSRTSTMAASG